MTLDNLAFLLPGQRVEDCTQLPARLPEYGLPAPFTHGGPFRRLCTARVGDQLRVQRTPHAPASGAVTAAACRGRGGLEAYAGRNRFPLELIPGQTLGELVTRGPLPPDQFLLGQFTSWRPARPVRQETRRLEIKGLWANYHSIDIL